MSFVVILDVYKRQARGAAVREHEQGVPFLFYNWNKYVNRNNPNETIDRTAYLQLDEEQKLSLIHILAQGCRPCTIKSGE